MDFRRSMLPALLFVLMLGVPAVAQKPAESLPGSKRVKPLMQMKLEKAKKILEALALEDYDQIGRNARQLKLLSLESGWNVLQTEEYATQSRDFQRATSMISEAAKDRDIGRAALGYVSLTVRCVECHRYVRGQQNASVE